jgi:hypothetical protein
LEFNKILKKDSQPDLANISALKELIKQVCNFSGVPGVIINNRISGEFKTKLWRLQETMAKAAAKGGSPVKRLVARWTSGRYSTWNFKIYYSELEPERLKQENVRLNAEKRKHEDDIDVLTCKKAKIEGKLSLGQSFGQK